MTSEENERTDAFTTCGLGQAIMWLDAHRPFTSEAAFRALTKPSDLPDKRANCVAVVTAIVEGRLRHSGTLVVMDRDFALEDGKLIDRQIQLSVVKSDYSAAANLWHIEGVNFYNSELDLTEPLPDTKLPAGLYRPWLRLREIRVVIEDLRKLGRNAASRNLGGAPAKIDWDAFWREVICVLYKNGTPQDDNAHWRELNTGLRRAFIDTIDDSYIRRKTNALRKTLKERGLITTEPGG